MRFQPYRFRAVFSALIASVICLTPASLTFAKSEWYQYENDHFIAYSDGDEDDVRELLLNMERFRAVFGQIGNIRVPEDTPRTRVLLFDRSSDFKKTRSGKNVAGFATQADGLPFIVMPVTGSDEWAISVVLHEYAHILLGTQDYEYPPWFNEGFAELMSSVTFSDNGRRFELGNMPLRLDSFWSRAEFSYDWNDLVADSYGAHKGKGARKINAYYAQSWLLAHYFIMGDEGKHASVLQEYFSEIKAGEESLVAFQKSVGMTPEELWESRLIDYSRRFPYYTLDLAESLADDSFVRSPAEETNYKPLVNYFAYLGEFYRAKKWHKKTLKYLPGRWAPLNVAGKCEDYFDLDVDGDVIKAVYSSNSGPGNTQPPLISYSYSRNKDRSYELNLLEQEEEPAPRYLRMPTEDMFCFGGKDQRCGSAYFRCPESSSGT